MSMPPINPSPQPVFSGRLAKQARPLAMAAALLAGGVTTAHAEEASPVAGSSLTAPNAGTRETGQPASQTLQASAGGDKIQASSDSLRNNSQSKSHKSKKSDAWHHLRMAILLTAWLLVRRLR